MKQLLKDEFIPHAKEYIKLEEWEIMESLSALENKMPLPDTIKDKIWEGVEEWGTDNDMTEEEIDEMYLDYESEDIFYEIID